MPRSRRRRTDIRLVLLSLLVALPWTLYAFECKSFRRKLPFGNRIRLHNLPPGGDFDTVDFSPFSNTDVTDAVVMSSSAEESSSADAPVDVAVDVDVLAGESMTEHELHDSVPPFFATIMDSRNTQPPLQRVKTNVTSGEISRRELFQKGALILFAGAIVGGTTLFQPIIEAPKPATSLLLPVLAPNKVPVVPANKVPVTPANKVPVAPANKVPAVTPKKPAVPAPVQKTASKVTEFGKLEPLNLTKVASETNVNVTMFCDKGCVSVDPKLFTKIKKAKVPSWLPDWLVPSPKVIKEIPNSELLVAATIAGGVTEMARTSILYPIQTIKTRIQVDAHNFTLRPPPIEKQLLNLRTNVQRYAQEGNLYAGIAPTLLVSVPATGVYFGIRDVTKRMLAMTSMDDVAIALSAAVAGDVVSLCFRTPADALALRLQAQDGDVGDWLGDSYKRLPMVIITDLPYLVSKIALKSLFVHGSLSIDRYAEWAIVTAVLAAFLTTPFDVARTRILTESNSVFPDGRKGGEGVIKTMRAISKEGQGGYTNLFAGWLVRVLYLGIGRAWLEPIQLVGYIGIRDALLLEWF